MKDLISSETIQPGSDVRILIVDDDKNVLKLMECFVNSYNFRAVTAEDGRQAVLKMQEEEFDIVISDISMPNMDGMELLQHVKNCHPETGVIIVTGYSEEHSYIDVINAGAIDYMTKPIDHNELHAKLLRVIREQKMFQELKRMSVCDSLTGIFNRRYFDKKIVEELHRAVRQNYQVFLTLLDVDNFKEYNDKFGHQSGDEVLTCLGSIILNNARREVDWAFRYGGDEFAVIITQVKLRQAVQVNKRVMSNFNKQKFYKTSLSCGLAEFKRNSELPWDEDIKKFINRVDMALYEAKSAGRNRIVCV